MDLTKGFILSYEFFWKLDLSIFVSYLLFHNSLETILLVQLWDWQKWLQHSKFGHIVHNSNSDYRVSQLAALRLYIFKRNLFDFFMFLENFTSLDGWACVTDLNKGLNTIKERW